MGTKINQDEINALQFFKSMKQKYEMQRQPLESKWKQALVAALCDTESLDAVYSGRAKISSPIMKWKIRQIVARVMRIIFNTTPIGRIEDKKINKAKPKNIIDLWNKYIFSHQLEDINFKSNYREYLINKVIYGSAVAKVTQEYEVKEFDYFDDAEEEEIIVRDNTYFTPILITEFYSDVNKRDINKSDACIHATTMSFNELKAQKKEILQDVFEVTNPITGEVTTETGEPTEKGVYKNLELLEFDGSNLSQEQQDYAEELGYNRSQLGNFRKTLGEIKKTGYVQIDECYGKTWFKGKYIEVICTIANGNVVIRFEPTPFKHRRYVRPFIVGQNEVLPHSLYGQSNVITGANLYQELNATRTQAIDAKTRSISNMWYKDVSKSVVWDNVWRPNGVIKGNGPNGLTPIVSPALGNVTINDTMLIQRDMDQLWNLSPVQEGTSDNRLIPSTASGTAKVISQNDIVLNDIIDSAIDIDLKPFFEMIFERNLLFKQVSDLLTVWEPKDLMKLIQALRPDQRQQEITGQEQLEEILNNIPMKELYFEPKIKLLGNLELSNEVSHQAGYMAFMNMAMNNPNIAKRVDWRVLSEQMLRAFGIKDEAENIFFDEQTIAKIQQAQQQAQQQELQAQEQQGKQNVVDGIQVYDAQKAIDTNYNIREMEAEVMLERSTGQKVL